MSNINNDKKYGFKNASYFSKNITQHGRKLPVEDEDIDIIGTRTAINRTFQQLT